jgi:hypothetical protein
LKLQGKSIWRDTAHRYLGEIAMRNGNRSAAISHFKQAKSNELTPLNAYLTYRLSYAMHLLGRQREALHLFSEFFKKEWPESAPLEEWRDFLLKEMASELLRDPRDQKAWKEFAGERFYAKILLQLSEYEKRRGNTQNAYLFLKSLEGASMDEKSGAEIQKGMVDLSLLLKKGDLLLLHCRNLSRFYESKQDKREFEAILYNAALNLDKYYLQSKNPKNFEAVSKLSELYFEFFGQKGKMSADMYKLSAPYLKLWGTQ